MGQTYIFVLENKQGYVNFERFSYKRLSTCKEKMIMLYKSLKYNRFVQEDLEKTEKIVVYKTDYETTADNKVLEIDISDFMKMIGA